MPRVLAIANTLCDALLLLASGTDSDSSASVDTQWVRFVQHAILLPTGALLRESKDTDTSQAAVDTLASVLRFFSILVFPSTDEWVECVRGIRSMNLIPQLAPTLLVSNNLDHALVDSRFMRSADAWFEDTSTGADVMMGAGVQDDAFLVLCCALEFLGDDSHAEPEPANIMYWQSQQSLLCGGQSLEALLQVVNMGLEEEGGENDRALEHDFAASVVVLLRLLRLLLPLRAASFPFLASSSASSSSSSMAAEGASRVHSSSQDQWIHPGLLSKQTAYRFLQSVCLRCGAMQQVFPSETLLFTLLQAVAEYYALLPSHLDCDSFADELLVSQAVKARKEDLYIYIYI
jgi:hypothetical protein